MRATGQGECWWTLCWGGGREGGREGRALKLGLFYHDVVVAVGGREGGREGGQSSKAGTVLS